MGTVLLISMLYIFAHIYPTPNILDKLPGRARQSGSFSVFRKFDFMSQVFLITFAMLGVYYWDGTIYPCVFIHWVVVVVFQLGYGKERDLAPHLYESSENHASNEKYEKLLDV